ncbi:aminopeptidase N [Georgenia sp. MJ173]|uniref:aminopeptidase N n=1 Tax=Georgenia sunbinii TaxID=3117728 RepID=UPI002F26112D
MSNLTRTETRERRAQLAVHSYRVELDLRDAPDPAATTFATTTTLRLTSTRPETWLDFLGPAVHRVAVDGVDQPVRHTDGRVAITGLRTDGEECVVVVHGEGEYSRTGEGLHRFVDPVDGETYLYTQYEPADARRVFACFEQPDLKAPYTFVVTAPAQWHVLSNSVVKQVADVDGGACRWTFAPTPPVSTYITAVVAGPYHRVEGHWSGEASDGRPIEVPLGVWCRASLAEHLDAEEVLTVTGQGLQLFHEAFDYPYPWGKYDQVFVPEYNLGAMENPGLVTFTERYVFRSRASVAQHEARATTILHEMAHMWFGDLTTMRWWDDLWLKESFADFMGTHATATATRFTDAWTSFALRRKAWAYRQDQLPTTHPIVAEIPDLEAAKQNFDGITYAKGAAVLKQLVAFVGQEAFFAGAREYFRRHAYGSTTLPDLLSALEEASGRDLTEWAEQWLQTSGPSTIAAEVAADDAAGPVLHLEQTGDDAPSGNQGPADGAPDASVLRDHRLVVGLYRLDDDGVLRRTDRLDVEVSGALTTVALPAGGEVDLVLPNDDDLTYAKVRLDPQSTETALAATSTIASSLSRAVTWSALWNATRDAVLPAERFLDAVLIQAPAEPHVAIVRDLLSYATTAVEHYIPIERRDVARERLATGSWLALGRAEPGSDLQLQWARAFAAAAAHWPAAAEQVREALDGAVPGLVLDPEMRWLLWQALAATDAAEVPELDAELAREDTATTRLAHRAAVIGRPDAQVKAQAWESLGLPLPGSAPMLAASDLSNDEVDAVIAGYTRPLHAHLVAEHAEQYFALLPTVWAQRSIEIAERLVRGLFPRSLESLDEDGSPTVLRLARGWLAANADEPPALLRCLREELDDVERATRARALTPPATV